MPLVPIPLSAYNTTVPDRAREVLTDQLTARLRLRGVYPVVFSMAADEPTWLGWCSSIIDAPAGELFLAPRAATSAGALLDIYCHELAHRLMRNVDADLTRHAWPFAAMQSVLLRRAASHIAGRARIQSLDCYDVSDEHEDLWGWAIQRALDVSSDLAGLAISAEDCAERIWRIWFDDRHPSMRVKKEKS